MGETGSLFLYSFGSKLISFVLNIMIARRATKEAYGVYSIQISFVVQGLYFLVTEPLRRACQKSSAADGAASDRLKWFVPSSFIYSVVLLEMFVISGLTFLSLGFSREIFFVWLSTIIYLAIEPLWILHRINLRYRVRGLALAAATICRGIVTLLLVEKGVIGFAIGELAYTLPIFLIFVISTPQMVDGGIKELLPEWRNPKSQLIHFKNCVPFIAQTVIKTLLTHGEKLLAMWFLSSEDQGRLGFVYGVGSMINRLVLSLYEEVVYNQLSAISSQPRELQRTIPGTVILGIVMSTFVGIVFVLYGGDCIHIVYGASWGKDSIVRKLMSRFGVFFIWSCLNGTLESISHSISAKAMVSVQNNYLTLVGSGYLILLSLFRSHGTFAFLTMNSLLMAVRCLISVKFIRLALPTLPLKRALPSSITGAGLIAMTVVTALGKAYIYSFESIFYQLFVIGASATVGLVLIGFLVFLSGDWNRIKPTIAKLFGSAKSRANIKED